MKTRRSMDCLGHLFARTGVKPVRQLLRRGPRLGGDGVEAVPAQRAALRKTDERQCDASHGAVRPDGFSRVVGARGMKPAGTGKER